MTWSRKAILVLFLALAIYLEQHLVFILTGNNFLLQDFRVCSFLVFSVLSGFIFCGF